MGSFSLLGLPSYLSLLTMWLMVEEFGQMVLNLARFLFSLKKQQGREDIFVCNIPFLIYCFCLYFMYV